MQVQFQDSIFIVDTYPVGNTSDVVERAAICQKIFHGADQPVLQPTPGTSVTLQNLLTCVCRSGPQNFGQMSARVIYLAQASELAMPYSSTANASSPKCVGRKRGYCKSCWTQGSIPHPLLCLRQTCEVGPPASSSLQTCVCTHATW